MRIVRGSSIDGYSGFEKVTKRNNYYYTAQKNTEGEIYVELFKQ